MTSLTALKIKNALPGKHSDGRGLMLVVSKTGAKKWVFRIQLNGKRRDIGIGSALDVSLAEARSAADDLRRSVRSGIDPVLERRKQREVIPTFRQAALMLHEESLPNWKNKKHAAQWITTLEKHAFPVIGDLTVDIIEGPLIRQILAPIWLKIPETAVRIKQRIGAVLDFSHSKGWCAHEAPIRSITKGLPKQKKRDNHLPAMPWQEVPEFFRSMNDTLSTTNTCKDALRLIIMTATRSGELRDARWKEVDLDTQTWTIPATRMKAGKEHRIPLTELAVQLLATRWENRNSDNLDALIFEGQRPGRPLSDMTLTMALKRAGLRCTVHGFRSSFRDWCGEATNIPREIAEACLAHAVKNKVEAAYARTDYFEKRKTVMNNWAQHLMSSKA